MPLIYELSDLKKIFNLNYLVPYLTIIISLLLVSKIPTFSFKKISIAPKMTILILFAIGISFISLLFFTFETLLIFGLGYILTIPLAFFLYKKNNNLKNYIEDDHEDIL